MRSVICTLALAATVGVFMASPSEAQAQYRWRPGYYPPTAFSYYNPNLPNFNNYPWNYWLYSGKYDMTPLGQYANPYYYGYPYYTPNLSYYYTLPSYQYYYGPGYAQYYYNPGSYYYWLR